MTENNTLNEKDYIKQLLIMHEFDIDYIDMDDLYCQVKQIEDNLEKLKMRDDIDFYEPIFTHFQKGCNW